MVPHARPQLDPKDVRKILAVMGVTGIALLGIRGYYRDSMGAK